MCHGYSFMVADLVLVVVLFVQEKLDLFRIEFNQCTIAHFQLKSLVSESEEPNNDDKPVGGTGTSIYFLFPVTPSTMLIQHVNMSTFHHVDMSTCQHVNMPKCQHVNMSTFKESLIHHMTALLSVD